MKPRLIARTINQRLIAPISEIRVNNTKLNTDYLIISMKQQTTAAIVATPASRTAAIRVERHLARSILATDDDFRRRG